MRSISRVTGVHSESIRDLAVEDVQCDELWGYIRMKERTKVSKDLDDPALGDAYCFVAMERNSKLVLAWHLGRRTARHTDVFIEKLDRATDGRFQITTDGFDAYPEAHQLPPRHPDGLRDPGQEVRPGC